MDLHSFREGGDLFENTIYAELDGVSRKDRPTAAVNSNVATAPATAPVAGAASASIPATADYTDLPLHEGVVCDCCDGPIIGFRYKCTQCRDFDLCMSCEGKMRHREHIIVRMPEPFSGRPCRFNKWFRGAMPSASMDPAAAEKPSSSSKTAEERAKKHHKRHHGHHHRRSHDVASGEGGSATCGNFRTMADETNDSSSQNETESLGAKTLLWESGTFPIDPDTIYRGLNIVAGHLMRLADPTGGINTPRTAANAQTTAGQKGPSKRTTTDDKATTTSSPTETTTTPEKESTPKGDAPQEEQPQQQNNPAPAVVTHDTVNLMDLTLDNSPSAPSIPRPTAAESPMIIEPTTQQQQEPSTPVPRSNSENSFDGNDGEWTVIAKEGPNEEMEASDDHHRPSVSSTPVQTELAYDHLNRLLRTTISEQARITATSTPAAPVPVQHHPGSL